LRPLFRIKLYDHSFLDRHADVVALGYRQNLSGDGLGVQLQPMRSSTATHQLERAGDLNVLLHLLFDSDLLTDVDLVRRNIHFLSVDEDMPMTDKLPGLCMGSGKTKTHEHIVQAPFELRQQVLAGNTLLTDGFFEIRAELIFEDAVDALHLLLFPELQPVSDEFRPAIAAVLSRLKISLFDSAGWFETPLAFQKKLHSFSAAQPADRSNVSSQIKLSFSSADGSHCGGSG